MYVCFPHESQARAAVIDPRFGNDLKARAVFLANRLAAAQSEYSLTRAADVSTALWLTYITLGWMTVEGAAALLLGWASKSLLLEAFGIDRRVLRADALESIVCAYLAVVLMVGLAPTPFSAGDGSTASLRSRSFLSVSSRRGGAI